MKTNSLITRRDLLVSGVASLGGLLFAGCSDNKLPPTYGNLLRMGDNLTYAAHRGLLPAKYLAREYSRAAISSFPATGTTDPSDPTLPKPSDLYGQLKAGGFAQWRLSIEGAVARPGVFSLTDLKRFPARTQITRQMCEEGWSAIAEWTGVPVSAILDAVGILPQARYASFESFDGWNDCLDMFDLLHPQTILAYGMNGRDLPIQHGAPVRLRVETQLGYKSMKYIQRIVVRENFHDGGENGNIQTGWAWYAGI